MLSLAWLGLPQSSAAWSGDVLLADPLAGALIRLALGVMPLPPARLSRYFTEVTGDIVATAVLFPSA
ncbi:hypothetical protein CRD60_04720 [Bifidobacterium aemilianum]|uniref:Uncharacterized protein n=1 Tax=Bifidobacterium aemilianum TaxID=2493120 RepID=A0A366K889_9BIFI|nr:hypothetical protein CRD60_04720 [Bifidobacterium aemilianum]